MRGESEFPMDPMERSQEEVHREMVRLGMNRVYAPDGTLAFPLVPVITISRPTSRLKEAPSPGVSWYPEFNECASLNILVWPCIIVQLWFQLSAYLIKHRAYPITHSQKRTIDIVHFASTQLLDSTPIHCASFALLPIHLLPGEHATAAAKETRSVTKDARYPRIHKDAYDRSLAVVIRGIPESPESQTARVLHDIREFQTIASGLYATPLHNRFITRKAAHSNPGLRGERAVLDENKAKLREAPHVFLGPDYHPQELATIIALQEALAIRSSAGDKYLSIGNLEIVS